jgi:cytosine/adenosine deaminase-related metal-dependent hydrolase
MTCVRAAWVLPIDQPPIAGGWVAFDGGIIAGVGGPGDVAADAFGPLRDLGAVALLPGLVNAHTHLELSWLRGRVAPAARFTDWIRALFAVRGRPSDVPDLARTRTAALEAARFMRACGTSLIGDISNTLSVADLPAEAGLRGWVFHELLGFGERDDAQVRRSRERRAQLREGPLGVSVAAHAPYSVSRELLEAIAVEGTRLAPAPVSVHVAESPEEDTLMRTGTGPWRALLEQMGAWRNDWAVPGVSPVAYLAERGLLQPHTLAVHCTGADADDLARLRTAGTTVVTCPRSNVWVGVGAPPLAEFYASGVTVALGTDSLASVDDLNVFSELAAARTMAPSVPPARLLASATLDGARALGLEASYGSLTVGKCADIVAVALPGAVPDIESHLVGGVSPDRISWASRRAPRAPLA